jgi:hypothetical protein
MIDSELIQFVVKEADKYRDQYPGGAIALDSTLYTDNNFKHLLENNRVNNRVRCSFHSFLLSLPVIIRNPLCQVFLKCLYKFTNTPFSGNVVFTGPGEHVGAHRHGGLHSYAFCLLTSKLELVESTNFKSVARNNSWIYNHPEEEHWTTTESYSIFIVFNTESKCCEIESLANFILPQKTTKYENSNSQYT